MKHYELLTFCDAESEPFCLSIRLDSAARLQFELTHGRKRHERVANPTLVLLRYLAEHPKKLISKYDILSAIWPGSSLGIVDTYISYLRKTLGDDAEHPRFIETDHTHGVTFLLDVHREGDLGSIDASVEWQPEKFHEFISEIERGTGETPSEDLRILTTGISGGLYDMKLHRLLERSVRVKFLMLNPDNEVLNTRHELRTDKKPPSVPIGEVRQQISLLKELAVQYPHDNKNRTAGRLEYRISDIVPCGFVAHSNHRALLGIFLAQCSYVAGPMFDVLPDSQLWKMLLLDWNLRWEEAGRAARPKN